MNILITGATGFIGRKLCHTLLDSGHRLTVLVRNPAKAAALFGQKAVIIGSWDQLGEGEPVDAVVNLAGEPIMDVRWTPQRRQALLDSRVGLTKQLVAALGKLERKPSVLISGSAVGWYGDQGDRVLDETAGTSTTDFGHELCRQWEEAALTAEALGTRVCLLRTGLVIGRDGGFLARLLPLFRLGLGGRIGSGRQWMSWIHLDDHVAMTCRLLADEALAGVFNLTAPEPVTNGEFTRTLAAVLKRPALMPVPAWALRLAMGEMAELLLGGQRVVPRRLQQAGYAFRFASLETALRDACG